MSVCDAAMEMVFSEIEKMFASGGQGFHISKDWSFRKEEYQQNSNGYDIGLVKMIFIERVFDSKDWYYIAFHFYTDCVMVTARTYLGGTHIFYNYDSPDFLKLAMNWAITAMKQMGAISEC